MAFIINGVKCGKMCNCWICQLIFCTGRFVAPYVLAFELAISASGVFHQISKQNTKISVQENASEYDVCKISIVLSVWFSMLTRMGFALPFTNRHYLEQPNCHTMTPWHRNSRFTYYCQNISNAKARFILDLVISIIIQKYHMRDTNNSRISVTLAFHINAFSFSRHSTDHE